MARGELVGDDLLFALVKAELDAEKSKVVILDGYPRTLAQAETLASLADSDPVVGAVHLDVNRSALIERLSGRRVCEKCGATYHIASSPPKVASECDRCGAGLVQRPDDSPDSISVRLDVYDNDTKPVLDYYRQHSLYQQVSGEGPADQIFEMLTERIDRLAKVH